ncbi:MAG: hypothetical protein ACLUIS_00060 [Longibaculum sp.]
MEKIGLLIQNQILGMKWLNQLIGFILNGIGIKGQWKEVLQFLSMIQ